MNNAATEKVETTTTKNGQRVTDTQIVEYRKQKRTGKIAKAEYDTILLLSDGRKRTAREIANEMGIEISNVTRNVNNLKKRDIIPTPTKTTCKEKGTTVSNYTLTDELLNIKTVSTLRFSNEVERLLREPIYNFPQMIYDELKRQGMFSVVTRERAVLAIFECTKTKYITRELTAAQTAELEAEGVDVIEVLDIDDFVTVFKLEKL